MLPTYFLYACLRTNHMLRRYVTLDDAIFLLAISVIFEKIFDYYHDMGASCKQVDIPLRALIR